MKRLLHIICVAIAMLSSSASFAWQVSGTVTDEAGQPLPYVSVYVQNTTHGVATNPKGKFYLELSDGDYTLVFQMIGYGKTTRDINVKGSNLQLAVEMNSGAVELEAVEITAGKRDPAYEIIKAAIKARKKYQHQYDTYRCQTYIKASLEQEPIKLEKVPDSVLAKGVRERMNLVESYGSTWYEHPGQLKEIKTGYRDLSDKQSGEVTVTFDFEEENGPPQYVMHNPFLYYLSLSDGDFDFYHSTIDVPALGETPFVSPIGGAALLSYKYELEETFYQDGKLTYKIKVIPRFREGALFSGHVYIRDGDWNLKAVDLEINKSALRLFRYFKVIIDYEAVNDSIWVPVREEFFYNTRSRGNLMIGQTVAVHSDYDINVEIPPRFFRNELRRIEDEAYEQDSTFWGKIRPITLKTEEQEFIKTVDSIESYHTSAEYLREQDSIQNRLTFWDFTLTGVGFRNSAKKQSIYFNPLIAQVRPLGVGGYRHAFGGEYDKEWSRAHRLELGGEIDYGFSNEDVKGEVNIGFTYNPKRFSKVRVEFGDIYDLVNTYESVEAIFSRSNYVRRTHYGVSHRMEFFNGFYVDGGVLYSDMQSIEGLQLSDWSAELFGEDNAPRDFERYKQFVFEVRMNISFRQKYFTEPYKKIIIGTDFPKVNIHYKKGLPTVFGSEVNFDFLEINVNDEFQIGTLGESKWNVTTGRFLQAQSLRFIEHKFFRGSDKWWFSNPLLSFQLLGPSINTPEAYFQANYIHHFNGALLNKIPLLNRIGMRSVGGAALLLIEENNFRHQEAFAGLEIPFRIGRQYFKFGTYYSISDSNYSDLNGQLKFGIDFFNSFTNKWSY